MNPGGHRRCNTQAWSWEPTDDEFIPDLVVTDGDPAAPLLKKAEKYAGAGLRHSWVIDPDGPEIIEHRLVEGEEEYRVVGRHAGDEAVTLPVGPVSVTLVPGDLVG